MSAGGPVPIELSEAGAPTLRGESVGEGLPIILCHGLTATRRYVVHGSKLLTRRGLRIVSFDARGHGESDPAPAGEGYGYEAMAGDLARLVQGEGGGPVLAAGHSMGAHTVAATALMRPELFAGLILICPSYNGHIPDDEQYKVWTGRADALETKGPEAFADAAVDPGSSDPDLLRRLALQRIKLHRSPTAVAEALRQVPRSRPFPEVETLSRIELPTLVVASRDEFDPGHPYAVGQAWAEAIPGAELISEPAGASPLAWQGGRLSREIATFAEQAGLLGG